MPNGERWAIVDLMGHKRIAGRIREDEQFGVKQCVVDYPTGIESECLRCDGSGKRSSVELMAIEAARTMLSGRLPYPLNSKTLDPACPACEGKGKTEFKTFRFSGERIYLLEECSEAHAREVAEREWPSSQDRPDEHYEKAHPCRKVAPIPPPPAEDEDDDALDNPGDYTYEDRGLTPGDNDF